MSQEDVSAFQSAGSSWRLSFRAVRVHNAHLQSGRFTGTSCVICQEGLGGAMAKIEEVKQPPDKDEVVEGGGSDEEGDATPSYSDWYSARGKKD